MVETTNKIGLFHLFKGHKIHLKDDEIRTDTTSITHQEGIFRQRKNPGWSHLYRD